MVGIWKNTEHDREENENLPVDAGTSEQVRNSLASVAPRCRPPACVGKRVIERKYLSCTGHHSTISPWEDLLCFKWLRVAISITTSLAYTDLCHPRRNLWGRRRYHSCLRTCACRGLRLGFSCSLRLFSLAVRFLQWPLGLFSGNSHSVYGSVGGRDPGKVYFSLPRVRFLLWEAPRSLWGGLAQGTCGAHAASYDSSVFLAAYAPPMGGSRHPLFGQIGLGQKPLKVTFVDDPMHQVYGEIWTTRSWGLRYDREASKWKNQAILHLIREEKGFTCFMAPLWPVFTSTLLSTLNVKPNADDPPLESMLAGRSQGWG